MCVKARPDEAMKKTKIDPRQSSPRILGKGFPEGWYWAELINECRVDGRQKSTVWVNIHLIRAKSANEAYVKSLALGRKENQKYLNVHGGNVTWKFRGFRNLYAINEKFADGAEIFYDSYRHVPEPKIKKMIRQRSELAAIKEAIAN